MHFLSIVNSFVRNISLLTFTYSREFCSPQRLIYHFKVNIKKSLFMVSYYCNCGLF